MLRTSGGARYISTCYGRWRRDQAQERAETGRTEVTVGGVVVGRWWQGICARGWPVCPVWARFGGGVCYKVAPAGGAAPGPSTLAAATGCPRYELSGALTGWAVRVRLGEALGGSLLTSTGRVIFYQPVW